MWPRPHLYSCQNRYKYCRSPLNVMFGLDLNASWMPFGAFSLLVLTACDWTTSDGWLKILHSISNELFCKKKTIYKTIDENEAQQSWLLLSNHVTMDCYINELAWNAMTRTTITWRLLTASKITIHKELSSSQHLIILFTENENAVTCYKSDKSKINKQPVRLIQ